MRASILWRIPSHPITRAQQGCCHLVLVSVGSVKAKGTSYITRSGSAHLGSDGARQLAGLLRKAPPKELKSLDLRPAT